VVIGGVAVCFGQENPVFLHTAKKIFILAGLADFFIARDRVEAVEAACAVKL
jgi:hypothetical protein